MMRTLRRGVSRRRALGLGGAVAIALVLAACNPFTITPTPGALGFSQATYYYRGPSEVWFEVQVRGTGDLRVAVRTSVVVPGNQGKPENEIETRTCGDAEVKGKEVACVKFYDIFPHAEPYHRVDKYAPGTFWPTIKVRSDEQVQVHVYCFDREPGPTPGPNRTMPPSVTCPGSTRVEARAVDGMGKLVGDLDDKPFPTTTTTTG